MIRSLGSSLLAKAGAGSLSRKKEEARITKPEIPGKGAVGTAGRDLTQETNITPVAPGSEKVIRSAPGIESASLPGMAANQVPLVAGIGLPNVPSTAGAANQPMFQGGGGAPAPASQAGQAGRQAQVRATTGAPIGAVAGARAERAAQAAAEPGLTFDVGGNSIPASYAGGGIGLLPSIANFFGGRVQAAPEAAKAVISAGRTTAQKVAGAAGKALTAVGTALKAPQLAPGGLGAQAQTWGGQPVKTVQGNKIVAQQINPVQAISTALRSVTQAAKNTVSKLRSKLFGK